MISFNENILSNQKPFALQTTSAIRRSVCVPLRSNFALLCVQTKRISVVKLFAFSQNSNKFTLN